MITTAKEYLLFIYTWKDGDPEIVVTDHEISKGRLMTYGLKLLKKYTYTTREQRTNAFKIAFKNSDGREATLSQLEQMAA